MNTLINRTALDVTKMSTTDESVVVREEILGNGSLIYHLLKTNRTIEERSVCVYGIRIVSTLFQESESETVLDVSGDFTLASELFDLAHQNVVLPCTLKDITYDFLIDRYGM